MGGCSNVRVFMISSSNITLVPAKLFVDMPHLLVLDLAIPLDDAGMLELIRDYPESLKALWFGGKPETTFGSDGILALANRLQHLHGLTYFFKVKVDLSEFTVQS